MTKLRTTGKATLAPQPSRSPVRPSGYRQRLGHSSLDTSSLNAPPLAPTVVKPTQPVAGADAPSFAGYRYLVRADLYRKTGRVGTHAFVKALMTDMGFKHTFWFRSSSFCRARPALKRTLYPLVRAVYQHYQHKHGVWIPPTTDIGPGLFLEHLGGIVVNGRAVIGKNCNLGHGVTIGQTNRGARQGTPQVGDNVFIGPGAKLVGSVKVGDYAAIGVNCVVVKDVPENAVVVAGAGQIVSYGGSSAYVNRTDY